MNQTQTQTLKYSDIDSERAGKLAQSLHIKKDEIQLVRKFYTVEKSDVVEDERSIVARVSTKDRDRDGEIVEPKGIDVKAYQRNPVLLWSHRYADPPIGKALWTKADDDGMIAKFQFANTQFAEEIYQLYKGGYLNAFSIGFISNEFDTDEKIHKKINLLEVSAVPVPANENAVVIQEAFQKGIFKSAQLQKDLDIVVEPDESVETVGDLIEEKFAEAETEEPITVEDEVVAEPDDHADLVERIEMVEKELAEQKEGRVLSTANRALVKNVLDAIEAVREPLQKLYDATDPTPREESVESAERSVTIEADTKAAPAPPSDERLAEIVAAALDKRLGDMDMSGVVAKALRVLRGKCD